MATSLFYSWQSDLPSGVTREFIREALDAAADAVNSAIEIEDAIRVTSDTEDAPGHPPIFETILEKIDTSSVFVPDVSIVTEIEGHSSGESKGLFNPNVAIEYGYALKSLGQKRLIPVMNTAFGGLKKLPFDMAHRRGPIRFHLPENASDGAIEREKEGLIDKLTHALTVMRQHDLLAESTIDSADPPFVPVAPYEGADANNRLHSLLGRINPNTPFEEGDTNVWLREGPSLFLRLIPSAENSEFEPLDLLDLMNAADLTDLLGYRTKGEFYRTRNRDGAAAFSVEAGPSANNNRFAYGYTQVLTNSEIWGVDSWLLDPERSKQNSENDWPSIGSHILEEGLINALSQYLKFARDHLKIATPLRWVAGMKDIHEHRLAIQDGYSGLSYKNTITSTGLISDYTTPIHEILLPFFDAVWREFGKRRPQFMTEIWEGASGFNLEPLAKLSE